MRVWVVIFDGEPEGVYRTRQAALAPYRNGDYHVDGQSKPKSQEEINAMTDDDLVELLGDWNETRFFEMELHE